MNTNIINPSVEILSGKLSVIGQKGAAVLLMVSGVEMIGDIDMSKIADTWITTRLLGDTVDSVIFEHDIWGELRNPRGLLQAVRNKIMQEISNSHELIMSTMSRPDFSRFRIIEDENRP